MKEIILKVEGMVCGGCENRIQNALKTINGVEDVVANHENGTVKIILNNEVEIDVLKEKVEDIGFSVVEEN